MAARLAGKARPLDEMRTMGRAISGFRELRYDVTSPKEKVDRDGRKSSESEPN